MIIYYKRPHISSHTSLMLSAMCSTVVVYVTARVMLLALLHRGVTVIYCIQRHFVTLDPQCV